MEGNPEFTNRLTKLEDYISAMDPRPVEHIHIFKESVVTAIDGPTKLFLDKTSVKENVSEKKDWEKGCSENYTDILEMLLLCVHCFSLLSCFRQLQYLY